MVRLCRDGNLVVIDPVSKKGINQLMHRYKVTCLECGEYDVLTVDDVSHQVVDYEKKIQTPFQSFRWRGDMSWGYYCNCGNDNRLASGEASDFDKLVAGDPVSVKNIAASLLKQDEKQFKMERV